MFGSDHRTKRWSATLAAGAMVAAGLVMVPGTASANGNCVTYWAEGTGTWSGAPAAGGDGSAGNPYKVGSETDLNEVRWCPDQHFVQIADFSMSPGWQPILGEGAADGDPFTGVYDGAEKTISGLSISLPAEDYVGLFRVIAGSGRVTDVSLSGVDVTGQGWVGAVAATLAESGEISRVDVSGSVTGTDGVAGLVGLVTATAPGGQAAVEVAGPTITEVASSANVTASAGRAGGIAAEASDATISKAAASGTLSGGSYAGGIVAQANSVTLTDLATDVAVTSTSSGVGGIAGLLSGTSSLSDSAAAGSAHGTHSVGGLVGSLGDLSTVTDTATDVTVTADNLAGGLIGAGFGFPTVTRSVAAGSVTADSSVGGLIGGQFSGAISLSDSAASGAVTGMNVVGGLAGLFTGKIHRSTASGTVTASGDDAGGLVGAFYANANVCGGAASVCAAIPEPDVPVEIRESYASGAVTGHSRVGGLVGVLADDGLCANAVPAEDVQVCAAVSAEPTATVINSYATGKVTATDIAGGLVGSTGPLRLDAESGPQADQIAVEPVATIISITNTYNSGVVAGSTRGGVLGEDPGNATVTHSFWDETANPGLTGAKGVGKTQAQLRDIATFQAAQWLIQKGAPATGSNVWGICVPPDDTVSSGYPFLLWQHTSVDPCHPVPAAPVLKSLMPGNTTLAVQATLGADGGNPVTKVQYQLDGGDWKDSGGASGSFTITGLTNGKTYKVKVRAVNAIGASNASNELSGTPTADPPAVTLLTLKGLPDGSKLDVDDRNVLVRSARTNGQIVVARVICTLRGNRLPPRLKQRLCDPVISGPVAADVAATKVKKKKLRVAVTPACSAGLKVKVKVAAKAKGASRKVVTRTYKVDNRPRVKCRIRGTG